ncbi:MAG: hypothetical protein AAGE61_00835 [Pseudomonadota bacterium]
MVEREEFGPLYGQLLEMRGALQAYYARSEDPPSDLVCDEILLHEKALRAPVTCIQEVEQKIQMLLPDADNDQSGEYWIEAMGILLRDLTSVRREHWPSKGSGAIHMLEHPLTQAQPESVG